MSNKRVYSKSGPNGKTLHYNSSGKYIGSSAKSFNGNVNHFDANGKFAGKSWTAPSGAVKHFDAKGKYTGSSIDSALGGQIHFDAKGRVSGRSTEGFGNRYSTIIPEPESVDSTYDSESSVFGAAELNKTKNPNNKSSTIKGIILVILLIADIIILRDFIWPILFLGLLFLLFAAGNS